MVGTGYGPQPKPRASTDSPEAEVWPHWSGGTSSLPKLRKKHNHRYLRVVIPWTRTRKLHIVNIYAHDVGYADRLELNSKLFRYVQENINKSGRVPWVIGGDFNQEPHEDIPQWIRAANVVATEAPTHIRGRKLDWFMATPNLGVTLVASILEGSPLTDHVPVLLVVPTFGDIHLGQSIRKTPKLVPSPEQRDDKYKFCFDLDQNINELWKQWTTQAEEWLFHCLSIFPTKKEKGRGQGIHLVDNTVGARQLPQEATAETKASFTSKVRLAAARRIAMYNSKVSLNDSEKQELDRLTSKFNSEGNLPSIHELERTVE